VRKWLPRLLLLAVVAAVVLRFTVLRPEPVPVRVARVERARVESTVTNSKAGSVRARRRAELAPEASGRVVEIRQREGDRVEQGELLVRLDDATPKAQLLLAEAGLRVAEANADQACISRDRAFRELARKRSLAEKEIVSDDLLDALQSAYQEADASCTALSAEAERAQAAIVAARADLAKYSILAPFAGVIAEQDVELGEWITPSPPLLVAPAAVDLIDPDSLYVSAPMDEVDSARIRVGQEAKVTVDSHPGRVFAGRVVRVAPYVLDIEAQNRTVEIEVEFVDPAVGAELLPGTSADVEVVLEVHDPVLRIPTAALLEGDRVLVPEDGTLEEREVQIGLKNWEYAEVLGGLESGQPVVVSLDRLEVKPGARVRIEEGDGRAR
jgi:HlyD family secretion protein